MVSYAKRKFVFWLKKPILPGLKKHDHQAMIVIESCHYHMIMAWLKGNHDMVVMFFQPN